MFLDLLLFLSIGPIIGFFTYYLISDRRRSEDYFADSSDFHLEL